MRVFITVPAELQNLRMLHVLVFCALTLLLFAVCASFAH